MDPSQSVIIPLHPTPAASLQASVPTSNISNTTADTTDGGLMNPVTNIPHGEGESETERAGTQSPTLQMPKLAAKTKIPIPTQPRKEVRTLIDLPVDVLKEIVKEVNNTNDLVSLSLTCRCLHALSTPHIYSRFDIVWPDSNTVGDRSGVDALTYGLATLVASGPRGNNYGRYIRKFSLGNGPADWVGEYNISKEGGKMLGTLVNLAIMRMQTLETFNWDMPTGVLRDIFMSLHDLCPQSLKNVHVRFHDNSDTTAPSSQDPTRRVETPTFKGFKGLRQLSVLDIDERQYLEEIAYAIEESVDTLKELRIGLAEHVSKSGKWIWDLDEVPGDGVEAMLGGTNGSAVGGVMGILVNRICELPERRRKLRGDLGAAAVAGAAISTAAVNTLPAAPTLEPATQPEAVAGDEGQPEAILPPNPTDPLHNAEYDIFNVAAIAAALPGSPVLNGIAEALLLGNDPAMSLPAPAVAETSSAAVTPPTTTAPKIKSSKAYVYEDEKPYKQLKLDTLDLERAPISVRVLQKVIDWSVITSLTILNCPNHEKLWKMLRRRFSPFSASPNTQTPALPTLALSKAGPAYSSTSKAGTRRIGMGAAQAAQAPDYKIRLKKLHTDSVSPSLVAFIKETLPPNSLEILFLQENTQQSDAPTGYSSPVSIDMIFKCCIKRHRVSLRKLLVDSNVGSAGAYESDKWRFNRDVISFITTSGKMPRLRELGCAIDYKDWHFFLTRLPGLAGLRSLYLPHVKGAVQLPQMVCREMALQIVDVVSLRNEVEICYVGIMSKCFELLEGKDIDEEGVGDGIGMDDLDEDDEGEGGSEDEEEDLIDMGVTGEGEEDEDDGIEEEDELEDEEGTGAVGGQATGLAGGVKDEESGDEVGGGVPTIREAKEADKVRVQLREILFYDDKVAVFKARSGKL